MLVRHCPNTISIIVPLVADVKGQSYQNIGKMLKFFKFFFTKLYDIVHKHMYNCV